MHKVNWKRNTALFMAGQGLSLFGSMLVHYAVMWHITLKTQKEESKAGAKQYFTDIGAGLKYIGGYS